MDIDQNGLFLGLNYRRNSNKVFNWGIFLLRSSANSELDFFEDTERLLDHLNSRGSSGGIGSSWAKIETHAMGGELHINFINRPRHFLSLGAGLGFYTSRSTNQRFSEVTETSVFTEDGEFISSSITSIKRQTRSQRKTEPFVKPALNYQYIFASNYFMGVEANLLLDLDSQELTQHPVLANFYSFNLCLGKRF
jgi:hypothetical protein